MEIGKITNLEYHGSVLNIEADNEKLIVSDAFVPEIVDANFNEVEKRINVLESTVQRLNLTIEKLTNKVNILNAVLKNE